MNALHMLQPAFAERQLPPTDRYWERAILLSDKAGASVGRIYPELTGY